MAKRKRRARAQPQSTSPPQDAARPPAPADDDALPNVPDDAVGRALTQALRGDDRGPLWLAWVLIAAAVLIGVLVRMIWIWWAQDVPSVLLDGTPMLTASDGYHWATVLRLGELDAGQLLRGRDWTAGALTSLPMLLVELGFARDVVLIWFPILVAPLLAIPIVHLGRELGHTFAGFAAAAIAVIANSYYNRTMAGYFDTDVFAVTIPIVVLWGLVAALRHRSLRWTLLAALAVALSPWFYTRAWLVCGLVVAVFVVYVIVRDRREHWCLQALVLLGLALLPLSSGVRAIAVLAGWLLLERAPITLRWRWILPIGAVGVALFYFVGPGERVFGGLIERFTSQTRGGEGLTFVVADTLINEAQAIPFERVAERISGEVWLLVLSGVGWILGTLRHRALILSAPLFAMGVMSVFLPLRFTIYAAPVAAIGLALLAEALVTTIVAAASQRPRRWIRAPLAALLALGALIPHIEHAVAYQVVPATQANEAQLMESLGDHTKPGDFALSWWDYGYPLSYYAGVETLVDGAKHRDDLFIISRILTTSSPREASNLARLAVERYVQPDVDPYLPIVRRLYREMADAGVPPSDFLAHVGGEAFTPPPATRDIYLYLPRRMVPLLLSVWQFQSLDPSTGSKRPEAFFVYAPRTVRRGAGMLDLGRGLAIDTTRGMLVQQGRNQAFKLRRVIAVRTLVDGSHEVKRDDLHADGKLTSILLDGAVVVVDDNLVDSMYMRMLLFDEVDSAYFEQVISDPWGKVFRLKR